MGESGQRRSTLVSRLPIFRRSSSKRQESLPSSPSSGGVGNGVHTSSPSSTNSSSGSTGKRRSLFRTPSLGFHSKRSSEPRPEPAQLGPDSESQGSEPGLHQGGNSTKSRHSFGFGGHKQKKLPRSQTEDFEKASSNRNVFINCISSGTNEADDSGFLDDVSSKRSSRHKKQLLPKSFSAHHRFSKTSCSAPEPVKGRDGGGTPPKTGTPGSWPGDLGENSLQSPILSEDRTTAATPSDFVHVTEDSVSEADALPTPSPAPVTPETFADAVSTSQVFFSPALPATDKPLLPDAGGAGGHTQCESVTAPSEPTTLRTVEELQPEPSEKEEKQQEVEEEEAAVKEEQKEEQDVDEAPELSEESSSNPEPRERRARSKLFMPGRSGSLGKPDARPSHLRKPHTVSMCSSASPYHEVMRMERRWRSASEGAGGPRLHLNLRDPHSAENNPLVKQRTNSSSSKLGSLDVLNNLGSSELDEDDLMLDLDLSDDQRHRHVSRENSSQSLASCLNLLPSPLELPADRTPGRDSRDPPYREPRPMSLCLPLDEELLPGLEALPVRLMQQDCVAVKTLLLRLRRTLQESAETSPASSLPSLPISPCSEKSLPFKDPGREEFQAQQQLREKDELILRLQAELESVRASQKALCQKADRSTQTDPPHLEPSHPGRALSQSSCSNLRERRPMRSLATDPYSRPPAERAAACDERPCPDPSWCHAACPAAEPPRRPDHPPSQIPRAVGGSTASLQSRASPSRSLSSDSERGAGGPSSRSDRARAPPSATFAGRLGQPPRGPLSLHVYSRKNTFLQHSLQSAELQALAQQDG